MQALLNFDLLWVGIAVAGAGTLGFSIFFTESKSATARAFLFFTLMSICWSLANFASGRFINPLGVLISIRVVLFFATWHAFSFFILAFQYPEALMCLGKKTFKALIAWTTLVSLFTFTPFVYRSVIVTDAGVVTHTAPGIALFGLTILTYIVTGIFFLMRRYLRSQGTSRHQMEVLMGGMLLTFVFLITFDFIFPAFLNIPTLVPLGGLFLLPFIIGTAYAILHYRLFKIRVAIFGLLTFLLSTATFFDILFSNTIWLVLYRTLELVFVLISGIWLIRSMVLELKLADELEKSNKQQVVLIHFITHQVKGFLTKSRNIFSMALDGDFGQMPEAFIPLAQEGLRSDTQGVTTVQEILNAANVKSGAVTYTMTPLDLDALIKEVIETLKPNADAKKLELSFTSDKESHMFTGDRSQLLNALKNLIDNSIKYTPTGSVAVSLKEDAGKLRFTIQDTGVGITKEDMAKLFTEGGHGTESLKVNVESTGFGLYIVKNIIEAHHGKVWAESEGAGKGSRFIVELPLSTPPTSMTEVAGA